MLDSTHNGPLARYVKLRVAHAPRMPGTFSLPPLVSDPDMHHGTCVTHVPRCMPGSLTSGFLWCRCRGKRSRHSRRMRNPQFCVSGKRPMVPMMWEGISNSSLRLMNNCWCLGHFTGLCRGIHRPPVDSPHKGPITWDAFPCDDVILSPPVGSCHGQGWSPSSVTVSHVGYERHPHPHHRLTQPAGKHPQQIGQHCADDIFNCIFYIKFWYFG